MWAKGGNKIRAKVERFSCEVKRLYRQELKGGRVFRAKTAKVEAVSGQIPVKRNTCRG
jgi:hypothetical protein